MSKKIEIDIEVNGKMTKATVDAKKLRGQLDDIDDAQKKTTKSSDKFQKGLKGVGEQSANASKNFSKFSHNLLLCVTPSTTTQFANLGCIPNLT